MFESLLCFLNEVPSWLNQEHCALLFLSSFSLSHSPTADIINRYIRLLWNIFSHFWRMFVKHELVVKDHETMHKCFWGWGLGWKMGGIIWPTSKWLIYCRGFWDPMCFYLSLILFFWRGRRGDSCSSLPPPASFPWFRLT